MTSLEPLALPHIRGLLAALDDGDDTVLPILADALEEAGEDRLATGLRRCVGRAPGRARWSDAPVWAWMRCAASGWPEWTQGYYSPSSGALACAVTAQEFDLLEEQAQPHNRARHDSLSWAQFVGRSAAFLALAQALVP